MKTEIETFQCSAKQALNYQNLFQLSVTAGTCEYCSCDDQIKQTAATAVCEKFDTDCDGLVWQDWSECVLPEDTPCGVGERTRLRKCGTYTTFDDVKKMCYDPWVKRTGAVDLVNNENYYQTESCVVQCPEWGPWTPCSAAPGAVGVQMRFEQGNPANQDIRQCSVATNGPKEDEVHYGPCNAICGKGKQQKITFNFLGNSAIVTEEECDTGIGCPIPILESCDNPTTTIQPTVTAVTTESSPPITKPTTQTPGGGNGSTVGPNVPVDPTSEKAGVKAIVGSIVALIIALML